MRCIICGKDNFELIHKGTRDVPDVDVYRCKNCGGAMLSSFGHITDSFYEDSGMVQDNAAMAFSDRQIIKDDFRRADFVLQEMGGIGKSILDFGCGYGGFLRLLKPYAENVVGVELEDAAREHISSTGIDVKKSIEETKEAFDIVTMFHVIEHLTDPYSFLRKIKTRIKVGG